VATATFFEPAPDAGFVSLRCDKEVDRTDKQIRAGGYQTDHIVRVLDGFMAAVVPHNIVANFRNAGVSLLLDDDRVICCTVTPETTRCLFGAPFSARLSIPEEEEEDLDMLG
jgi:hypothetical protein